MSPPGCQKMSAKPCRQNAEESCPVLSLQSGEQKPPNSLLIQDKDVLQSRPGVSFSDRSPDQTTGTINFSPPIPTGGRTAYFSLEEDIRSACSCPDVINNSVTHSTI